MSQYIKRIDALRIVNLHYGPCSGYNEIKNLPAEDVAPVVHGRWRPRPMIVNATRLEVWMCSVCRVEKTRTSIYCPNCGARMDGDDNE